MKLIGYNVYYAPEGGGETYYGFAESLEDAKRLADNSPTGLDEALYQTAIAAGHCGGLEAPDKSFETKDLGSIIWFGDDGFYCAVPVYGEPVEEED